jgi:galactokinase/mevalonate kinase-like predicted kinase
MTDIDQIREEIDRATERRAELWHLLSEGHDAVLAAELHELEERLAALWDEQRSLKARARFGDRDEIIKRARHEERLARAA